MRIEFVIMLGIASSIAWASACHACWKCGYTEGMLDEWRMCRQRRNAPTTDDKTKPLIEVQSPEPP